MRWRSHKLLIGFERDVRMNVTGVSTPIYAPCYQLNQTTGELEVGAYNYAALMEKIQEQIEEAKVNPPEIGDQTLSESEIQELAKKYDPQDMTQDEYDEFIRYLQEKGVLSQLETSDLGMSRITIVPGYFEPAYIWTSSSSIGSSVRSLGDVDGNAIRYAELMTMWEAPGNALQIRQNAFYKVLGILNQMDAARGSGASSSGSSSMYDMSSFRLGFDHIKFEHNLDISALIPDQNKVV